MGVVKIILFILSFISLGICLIFWQKLILLISNKKRFLAIAGSLITLWTATYFIKDYPLFEEGDCFVRTAQELNAQGESWHKPRNKKDIEYQVLKVGHKNYLVHSSEPRMQDFLIAKDFLGIKSDCRLIYKESSP